MDRNETKRVHLLLVAGLGLCALASINLLGGEPAMPDLRVPRDEAAASAPIVAPPAGFEREPSTSEHALGFYGAPAGFVMKHQWSADTTVRLEAEQGQASQLQAELAGELVITVLARRDDDLVAELAFPRVEGTLTTAAGRMPVAGDSQLALDFANPTLVHLRSDGDTLGYRFADGVVAEHRNLIRGIWGAMRFLPRATLAWSADERDLLGDANVAYRWTQPELAAGAVLGGVLQKRRLGYVGAPVGGYGALSGSGEGEARFRSDLGWIDSVRWQETSRRRIDEIGLVVASSLRFESRLVATDRRDVAGLAVDWEGAWQPLASEVDSQRETREADRQRRRLANVTIDQLIADLAGLAQSGALAGELGQDKQFDLIWVLRTQPEALAQLQRALPGLDPALAGAALAALGATQLPRAQVLLAEVFADGGQPASNRLSAAMAMVQIEQPSPELVQSMATTVLDAANLDDGALAGLLALGTLTGRAASADRQAALASLLAVEPAAVRQGATGAWLEALGNAGLDEALAAAARYRTSADAAVRVAAVSAVRHVRGDGAWQFAAAGLQDAEPSVRARSAEVLAERTEAGALAALGALLRGEADARVRRAAVGALVGRADEPAVRAMLGAVAAHDGDADARASAARALGRR